MRSLNAALAVDDTKDVIDDGVAEAARLLASGEVDVAVARIEAIRARDPRNLHLRFLLGIVAWRMHDYFSATNLLRELCEEADENGTFADTLATLRALVGDLGEALFMGKLGTALPADPVALALLPPDFPRFADAFLSIQERPLVRLAKALVHQGRLGAATASLEQHVRLFPTDIPAATELAGLLLACGRGAEAIQHFGPLLSAGDARSLSLVARASAAIGDRDGAARLHAASAEALPDDPEVTAGPLLDAIAPGPAAIEAWLRRFRLPPSPRALPARGAKRRVGYLVAGLAGSPLATLAAAVARRHDRDETEVYGYGFGELSADPNAELRGGYDVWRDVSRIDPRTIGRILEADGLDIVIDASGFRHVNSLLALFATGVPRRCGWLGLPVLTDAAPYDCILACNGETVPGPIPSIALGASAFAVQAVHLTRDRASAGSRIGVDLLASETTPEALALLSEILRVVPGASVVMRDHGQSLPIVVDRLIAQLGVAAGRVDLLKTHDTRSFLEQVDLLLAPASVETPRAAIEAMAHGVPVVIASGTPAGDRAAATARALSLGNMIAESSEDLLLRITGLLTMPIELHRAWSEAARAAGTGAFQGRALAAAINALIPAREVADAR